MIKDYISKIVSYSIVLVGIITLQRFASIPIGNLAFWWLIQVSLLLIFWKASYSLFKIEDKRAIQLVKWVILWNIVCIVRGIFIAELYWDWKALIGNGMALLLPVIVFVTSNKESLQAMLINYMKFAIPIYIVLFPFLPVGALGAYLYPVSFLMLFFPSLTTRWKVIVLIATLMGVVVEPGTRSYVVKYGIPVIFVVLYYSGLFVFSTRLLELSRKLLMLAPWILLVLALSGVFNVFKIDDYIEGNYNTELQTVDGKIVEQSVTEDSRSFLYEENLYSAQKYKYWLAGRSPARGHESNWFAHNDVTGRGERYMDEVGILNIFTWTGVIGVLLCFLVFYRASYLAINKSNNIYSKLIGLFVALRWMFSWVEDANIYNLNYFMIWLMIGICFSNSFRRMDNVQVKLWVRAIFNKEYLAAYKYYRTNYKLM